jgi:hypothetical protein
MLTEQTVDGWSGVITDLTAKRQNHIERLTKLRQQKADISLEAAMGSPAAKTKLTKINEELHHLMIQAEDFDSAIAHAEAKKHAAENAEADTAEQERQARITESLVRFNDHVQQIDLFMQDLVNHLSAAMQELERAEVDMTADERTPMQMLHGEWGPTLAAAHYGLGTYIQLGDRSMHIQHRKPLEQFVRSFIERWLPKKEENNGK